MTAKPADATKVHLDSATDDPKQARSELADLVDKLNQLIAHIAVITAEGDLIIGNVSSEPARLAAGLQDAVLVMGATQPAWTTAVPLTSISINGATGLATPQADDLLAIYDFSAGINRDITTVNLLKSVNVLTEDTAPDAAADFLLAYDASAGEAKKTHPDNLFNAVGFSTAAIGYVSLPGGIVLQWGSDSGSGNVSFPAVFPTQCRQVFASARTADRVTAVTSFSTSSFSHTTTVASSGEASTASFSWWAVGF